MKARCVLLALACTLFLPAHAEEDPWDALKKGQPKDVASLIDRMLGCYHLAGEEGYDAERRKELADSMKELKCARLDKDEAALRKRYARRPEVGKALDRTRATFE